MPPPRPWIAGLLSCLLPGLGHLYARNRRRAAHLITATAGVVILLTGLRLIPPVPSTVFCLLALVAVFLTLTLVATINAYVSARDARAAGKPRERRWVILLALTASFMINEVALHIPAWTGFNFQNYDIPSESMMPGLPVGTRLFTSPGPEMKRGSIVFFHPRNQDDVVFTKRIVGLAGDKVRFTEGQLFINNQAAAPSDPAIEVLDGRSYAILPTSPRQRGLASHMIEQVVPVGTIFVVGDNRDNSLDSRFPEVGPVSLDRITAVGGVIYWLPGAGLTMRQLD